jgi:hypothetical protein
MRLRVLKDGGCGVGVGVVCRPWAGWGDFGGVVVVVSMLHAVLVGTEPL